jgi:6-phosphogluconate dehydrogenase
MGQNLALNMARNNLTVTVYNRTWEKTEAFMSGPARHTDILAARDLTACVASLRRPRTILLMVKAGQAVDSLLDELLPLLEPGDIVMDGGNSYFEDTVRRMQRLRKAGILLLGLGVSGGEKGALLGPSLMPGGSAQAWEQARPILEAIAAKTPDGRPCAAYMGREGSGHLVKMVHNGIEYAVMQLLAEIHDLLSRGLALTPSQEATLFEGWNTGAATSYLLEITARILRTRDSLTGTPLLEVIGDRAGSKGTGLWTMQTALTLGVPVPTISAAVEARLLSAQTRGRETAAQGLEGPGTGQGNVDAALLGQGLLTATLAAYAQGFGLLRSAEAAWEWGLEPAAVARVWQAGCIIRAAFLDDLEASLAREADPDSLVLAPAFAGPLSRGHLTLRRVVRLATELGIPAPALSASLAWYDGCRSVRLPSNLIQAQRDYFGAHGFERTDQTGLHHGPWSDRLGA